MYDFPLLIQSGLSFLSEQNMALVVLAFICLNIIFSGLFLPCSIFAFSAGLIWGVWPGLIISQISSTISASFLFYLGRKVRNKSLPSFFEKYNIYIKLKNVISDVMDGSALSVVAVQINPFVPASSASLFFGASKIHFAKFIFLTSISILPLQIVIVTLGAAVFDLMRMSQIKYYTSLLLLVSSAVLITVLFLKPKKKV